MGLRDRWNRLTDELMGDDRYWSLTTTNSGMKRILDNTITQLEPGPTLDVGAGGLAFKHLLSQNNGIEYFSCDVADSGSGLDFIGDGCSLPIPDGALRNVICSAVIEHVPDTDSLMSELYRILAPGGLLVMTIPHFHYLHSEPHDYYRFTSFGISHVIRKAGLEVKTIEPVGGFVSFLSTLFSTAFLALFAKPKALRFIALAINKLFVCLCSAADARIDKDKKFALGYVAIAVKDSNK